MDIADQCSHVVVPCSAATASQRAHGRLDGMARPPHLAMAKFIAGWVGLAKRRVAKEEVECGSLGASGATFKGLRTSPEFLREFHRKFSCEFSCEFFCAEIPQPKSLEKFTGFSGAFSGTCCGTFSGTFSGTFLGRSKKPFKQLG